MYVWLCLFVCFRRWMIHWLDKPIYACVYGFVYVCIWEWSPLPLWAWIPEWELPRGLGRRYEYTHTHTLYTHTCTHRLICHTSSGRRMKIIFKHSTVWWTLIHISSCRANPAIIKQINWTFTRASIDLGNIAVLHSLLSRPHSLRFSIALMFLSSRLLSLGFSEAMASSSHYDRVSPKWSSHLK